PSKSSCILTLSEPPHSAGWHSTISPGANRKKLAQRPIFRHWNWIVWPRLAIRLGTNCWQNKQKAALVKPPSWSIDHFGKGSPIGSNRHDFVRPLFPWFSASSPSRHFRLVDG